LVFYYAKYFTKAREYFRFALDQKNIAASVTTWILPFEPSVALLRLSRILGSFVVRIWRIRMLQADTKIAILFSQALEVEFAGTRVASGWISGLKPNFPFFIDFGCVVDGVDGLDVKAISRPWL
jgi:hypothetical protein